MAEIQLIIDTNTGKVKRGMDGAANSTKKLTGNMRGLKGVSNGLLKTLGGAGLAGAALGMGRSLRAATLSSFRLADEMTGLLSLGNNIQNFAKIRKEVVDLSIQTGIATDEINKSRFSLQSSAGNLTKGVQADLIDQAIELNKATGTDLNTSLRVLIKTMQIYGGELGTVGLAQEKLLKTAELGDINFNQLSNRFPEVASAAKAMGFEMKEVGGALATATRVSGDAEKAFTGVRNIFTRLVTAEKKGIKFTGDFADQIEQINALTKAQKIEIFGEEGVAVTAELAANVKAMRADIEAIGKASGDTAGKIVALRRSQDPAFAEQEREKRIALALEEENRKSGGISFADFGTARLAFNRLANENGSAANPLNALSAFGSLLFQTDAGQQAIEEAGNISAGFPAKSENAKITDTQKQISVNQVKVANAGRGN